MKRDAVNYLAVGVVTVAALALLLLVLLRVTGTTGPTDRYRAVYAKVSGIRFGTPVFYEGYRIGQVERVEPLREGIHTRFEVHLAVDRGWPVPADSVARVASDGLLSDVYVHIVQGDAPIALEPGARIASREGTDLFSALGDLAAEARGLADDELRPLLRELGTRLEAIADPLAADTPAILDRVQALLESLGRSADAAEAVLGKANRGALARTLGNLEASSASAAALARELHGTREAADATLAELRGLVEENRPDVRRLVSGLESDVRRLGRRLDTIAFNLEEASRHFNEFARSVRRNPNRLLYTPERDPVATGEEPR